DLRGHPRLSSPSRTPPSSSSPAVPSALQHVCLPGPATHTHTHTLSTSHCLHVLFITLSHCRFTFSFSQVNPVRPKCIDSSHSLRRACKMVNPVPDGALLIDSSERR